MIRAVTQLETIRDGLELGLLPSPGCTAPCWTKEAGLPLGLGRPVGRSPGAELGADGSHPVVCALLGPFFSPVISLGVG